MVDKFINRFINHISGFAFLIAAIADLGLNGLFYFSLGFDMLTKIVLILWAFVIVGAKIYGWANKIHFMAISCAVLSVVASVSIFLAVLDTQQANTQEAAKTSLSAVIANTSLDRQIAKAENDLSDKTTRRDATPQDQTTIYLRLDKSVSDANSLLSSLRAEKVREHSIAESKPTETIHSDPVHINLDAWSIFKQLVGVDWSNAARVFALFFIIALATVLEIIVAYTTPRPEEEEFLVNKRNPTPISEKDIKYWVTINWYRYEKGTSDSILGVDDFMQFSKTKNKRFPMRKFEELKEICVEKRYVDSNGKILVSEKDVMEGLKA